MFPKASAVAPISSRVRAPSTRWPTSPCAICSAASASARRGRRMERSRKNPTSAAAVLVDRGGPLLEAGERLGSVAARLRAGAEDIARLGQRRLGLVDALGEA